MNAMFRLACIALLLGTIACKPSDDRAGDLGLALACANGDKHACEKNFAADKKRCDDGAGEGCTLLGLDYENGRVVPVDEAQATSSFLRACTLNDGNGCWYASRQHAYARGAPKDAVRAADLSEKGCTLGSVNGCMDLAVAFRDGDGRPKDRTQARVTYARACSLGKLSTGSGCKEARDLESDAQ